MQQDICEVCNQPFGEDQKNKIKLDSGGYQCENCYPKNAKEEILSYELQKLEEEKNEDRKGAKEKVEEIKVNQQDQSEEPLQEKVQNKQDSSNVISQQQHGSQNDNVQPEAIEKELQQQEQTQEVLKSQESQQKISKQEAQEEIKQEPQEIENQKNLQILSKQEPDQEDKSKITEQYQEKQNIQQDLDCSQQTKTNLQNEFNILRREAIPQLKIFSNQAFQPENLTEIQLKCLGCFYGMIVGDSWGHLYEFVEVQYKNQLITSLSPIEFQKSTVYNAFMLAPGQWTDDSSMGLCLADSLIEKRGLNKLDLKQKFWDW